MIYIYVPLEIRITMRNVPKEGTGGTFVAPESICHTASHFNGQALIFAATVTNQPEMFRGVPSRKN